MKWSRGGSSCSLRSLRPQQNVQCVLSFKILQQTNKKVYYPFEHSNSEDSEGSISALHLKFRICK